MKTRTRNTYEPHQQTTTTEHQVPGSTFMEVHLISDLNAKKK